MVLNDDKADGVRKEQATRAQSAMEQVFGEGESYTLRNLSIQHMLEILQDTMLFIF